METLNNAVGNEKTGEGEETGPQNNNRIAKKPKEQRKPKEQKKPKESPRKLKILMLHGYYQSGEIFQTKTGSFRKIGNSLADFVYITAPHEIDTTSAPPPESEAADLSNKNNAEEGNTENNNNSNTQGQGEIRDRVYRWWDTIGEDWLSATKYNGFEQSLESVKKIFREQGPFDGVLGFSQGGVFASILCCLNNKSPTDENPISFRFAIIGSAFPPSPKQYSSLFSQFRSYPKDNDETNRNSHDSTSTSSSNSDSNPPPSSNNNNEASTWCCPSLHLYGKGDTLVLPEWSRALTGLFVDPIVVEHEGGHYLPVTSQAKIAIRNFLQQNTSR